MTLAGTSRAWLSLRTCGAASWTAANGPRTPHTPSYSQCNRHSSTGRCDRGGPSQPQAQAAGASAGSGKKRAGRGDKSSAPTTTEEFHSLFEAQYGTERWAQLYAALAWPTRHVALLNSFSAGAQQQAGNGPPDSAPLAQQLEPWAAMGAPVRALQFEAAEGASYPPPFRDPNTGLSGWYWLDWASLVPPLALGVAPGHAILDMCAAPGGKSLVLAQLLFGGAEAEAPAAAGPEAQEAQAPLPGSLACNELDPGRRRRLLGVLKEYLPEAVRQYIRVLPHDGGAYWRSQEGECYDRVLLDAPCSSDRHIVQQAAARGGEAGEILKADWSVKRCRAIAAEQAKLLAAAVKALKPGGRVVYSTCSLATLENDEVVAKVLAKAGDSLRVVSHTAAAAAEPAAADVAGAASSCGSVAAGGAPTHPEQLAQQQRQEWVTAADFEAWGAERTPHGWLLLPDATGYGPIYLSVLEKVASTDLRRAKVNKYAAQAGAASGR